MPCGKRHAVAVILHRLVWIDIVVVVDIIYVVFAVSSCGCAPIVNTNPWLPWLIFAQSKEVANDDDFRDPNISFWVLYGNDHLDPSRYPEDWIDRDHYPKGLQRRKQQQQPESVNLWLLPGVIPNSPLSAVVSNTLDKIENTKSEHWC